jgi:RNA polymerase sigma-70 factor (ECF subfamily)
MDEKQAIARLKQGDLTGLETLVKQYQVLAVHTAFLIVADRSLAEDIVQAAFLKAAKRIGQFAADRPFRPWFIRIVVNDCLKSAQHQRRNPSLDQPSNDILIWLTDPNPGPEEMAETNELRQAVWNALQELPPEQRAVIVQRHFLGMRESEMVRELQHPSSSVKWWLHTARSRLQTLLSPYRNRPVENHFQIQPQNPGEKK